MAKQMRDSIGFGDKDSMEMEGILASRNHGDKPKNDELEFLTFRLGGEEYGVDIMAVQEIKAWSETRKLPNSPQCMAGVIDLRGIVVPIVDLRCRFHMQTVEADEKNVFIILTIGGRTVGILVDAVADILKVDADEIRPSPGVEVNVQRDMIQGLISIKDQMVVILHTEHLLSMETIEEIGQLTAE